MELRFRQSHSYLTACRNACTFLILRRFRATLSTFFREGLVFSSLRFGAKAQIRYVPNGKPFAANHSHERKRPLGTNVDAKFAHMRSYSIGRSWLAITGAAADDDAPKVDCSVFYSRQWQTGRGRNAQVSELSARELGKCRRGDHGGVVGRKLRSGEVDGVGQVFGSRRGTQAGVATYAA